MSRKNLIEAENLIEKLVIKLKKEEDDEEADEIRDLLDDVYSRGLSLDEIKLLGKYSGDMMNNIKCKKPSESL